MLVVFILGSKSDLDFAAKIIAVLDDFQVPHEEYVASAHKVPERVIEIINEYNESDDPIVYITIAGRSNALSGVIAANSIHPVIACPPFKSMEDYAVNIHSSLQMPSGTPVLTIIDPGNAALAAIRILANTDDRLAAKVVAQIETMKKQF